MFLVLVPLATNTAANKLWGVRQVVENSNPSQQSPQIEERVSGT
jgi:hypothetical protein